MTITEEEAKTKWCPAARCTGTIDDIPVGGNRVGDPWIHSRFVEQTKCIGSGCMAWRWCEEHNIDAMEHYEACAPGIPGTPPKPVGYCGLAGKP